MPTLGIYPTAQSLAALIYTLAARLARAHDEAEPVELLPNRLIEENLWRAIRYGLSGELIDLTTGDVRPARAHIETSMEREKADAVGYVTMGGVFAANMTGNTVLAGIAGAEGRTLDSAKHLAPLVAFFIGAMLARLLLRLWNRQIFPILLEAAEEAVSRFRRVGRAP